MSTRLLLAVLLAVFASLVRAEPQVSVDVSYYDIRGDRASELRVQMNRKGPRGFDAYTAWSVRWRYREDRSGIDCRAADLVTSVEIEITLPRWVDEADADEALRQRWQRFYSALLEHEHGHRDFGIRAAREVEAALATVQSQSRCAELKRSINTTGNGILAPIYAQERAYDRDTNHGINDGAVFP